MMLGQCSAIDPGYFFAANLSMLSFRSVCSGLRHPVRKTVIVCPVSTVRIDLIATAPSRRASVSIGWPQCGYGRKALLHHLQELIQVLAIGAGGSCNFSLCCV